MVKVGGSSPLTGYSAFFIFTVYFLKFNVIFKYTITIEKIEMNKTLFHVSENKNLKCLTSKIPRYAVNGIENTSIKRICCSTSIYGCLTSIYSLTDTILFVYKCLIDEDSKILNTQQIIKYVNDAEFTNEHWILNEIIPVQLLGKIKVIHQGQYINTTNSLGIQTIKTINLKYIWLNKTI